MAISTNGAIITRLAGGLYNTVLSNATYLELVSQDPSTLANKLYAADFAKKTDAEVGKAIVANLGLSALTGLDAWVAAQLTAAGAANKGAKIVSMLNDFAAMTADSTYGTYATAFNTKVDAALTSAQTTGKTEGKFETAGVATAVSFTLTTGADTFTGGAGDDTFNALTVNAAGTAADTVTAYDKLNGGAGNDTLNIYTTEGQNVGFATAASVTGIETVNIFNIDVASPADFGDASNFDGVTALWQHGAAVDVIELEATTTAGFSKLDANVDADLGVSASDTAATASIALAAVKGNASDNIASIAVDGAVLAGVTVSGTLAKKASTFSAKEVFTASFTTAAAIFDHIHFDGLFFEFDDDSASAAATATTYAEFYAAQEDRTFNVVDDGEGTLTFTAITAGDITDTTEDDFNAHSNDYVVTIETITQGVTKVTLGAATLDLDVTLGKNVTAGTVNTAVATTLTIDNAGTSTKDLLSVDASASAGAITYTSADAKVSSIKTGAGKDVVTLITATLKDDVTTTVDETISAVLQSGAGDDTLTVAVTGTGTTAVDAGEGNDKITLNTSKGEKVNITGGAGNDTVTIQDATGTARKLGSADVVDGGDGTDTLVIGGTAFITGDLVILAAKATSFETLQFAGAATADASKLTAFTTLKTTVDGVVLTKVADAQVISTAKDVTATSAGYIAKDTGATTPVTATTYAGKMTVEASTAGVALVANTSAVSLTVSATAGTATKASAVADVTLTGDAQTATVTLNSVADKTAGQTAKSTADSAATFSLTTTTGVSADKGSVGAFTNLGGLTSLTLTGTGSATIVNGSKLATVDASGLTGKAVFDGVTLTNGLNFKGSDALSETVTLSGGLDAVTTAATYSKMDTITGLNLVATAAVTPTLDAAKSDDLTITGFATGFVKSTTITGSTLDLALVSAAASASNNLVFQYDGNTYVFVDTTTDGALDSTDILVKLTGTINLDLLVQALNVVV